MVPKKLTRIIVIIPFFLFALLSCTPSKKYLEKQGKTVTDKSSYIKVRILKSSFPVEVTAKGRVKVKGIKSGKVLLDGKNKRINFEPEKVISSVLIESWDSPLIVNKKPYRGTIEIHNIAGKINVVNVVRMEDYLCGVVSSEMSPVWHIEALKAQAVAARTYAYYNLKDRKANNIYDLDSTTKFQVYKGMSAETENSNKAVNDTAGVIMAYDNKPILSVFHSTSGGRIIDNIYVWKGEDLPYLEDKVVPYGKSSPHYKWKTTIGMYEMKSLLTKKYRNVGRITGVSFRKHKGRVVEALITHTNGRIKITGNEFRMLFPGGKIKSQFFTAKRNGKGLVLYGRGWGHGVGMCQYSAKEMAEQGIGYKKILTFFYKDITLTKL